MKRPLRYLALAGIATLLSLNTTSLVAQQGAGGGGGRGNFDPEQMRQRMMERYREQLEVKGDDEWKVIQPRIEKVNTARREVGFGGMGMGRGGMMARPGGRGGDNAPGGDQAQNDRRRQMGGTPNPEAEALQKAIEAKASSEELKSVLAKYRASRKDKEAALEKAQDELRKILSVRQEAIAVSMGLLN